jgi:hypothetical protein
MDTALLQQDGQDPASSLCSLGMRPILMTGALRQYFTQHFTDPDRIEAPQLRQNLWRADINVSDIIIESLTRWRPDTAGVRPAVLIRRNDWQVSPLSIGNLHHGGGIDGGSRYSVQMNGSHTLFCLARESGEVEILAAEVYRLLLGFEPTIRDALKLLRFRVAQIGGPQPVLESREHWGVPITVGYSHEETWNIHKHAPLLRTIDLKFFR